jgi:hypothetical protein
MALSNNILHNFLMEQEEKKYSVVLLTQIVFVFVG